MISLEPHQGWNTRLEQRAYVAAMIEGFCERRHGQALSKLAVADYDSELIGAFHLCDQVAEHLSRTSAHWRVEGSRLTAIPSIVANVCLPLGKWLAGLNQFGHTASVAQVWEMASSQLSMLLHAQTDPLAQHDVSWTSPFLVSFTFDVALDYAHAETQVRELLGRVQPPRIPHGLRWFGRWWQLDSPGVPVPQPLGGGSPIHGVHVQMLVWAENYFYAEERAEHELFSANSDLLPIGVHSYYAHRIIGHGMLGDPGTVESWTAQHAAQLSAWPGVDLGDSEEPVSPAALLSMPRECQGGLLPVHRR